jgi:hypothetical protein
MSLCNTSPRQVLTSRLRSSMMRRRVVLVDRYQCFGGNFRLHLLGILVLKSRFTVEETDGSLPCLQKLAADPYREPDESSHSITSYFCKINFSIIQLKFVDLVKTIWSCIREVLGSNIGRYTNSTD